MALVSAAQATEVIVPTAIVHHPPRSSAPWRLALQVSRYIGWGWGWGRRQRELVADGLTLEQSVPS